MKASKAVKPVYVAKKSMIEVFHNWNWKLIFCVLVLPIFVLIYKLIAIKKFRLEFYDDKIIIRRGWLNPTRIQLTFAGVAVTVVRQSFFGLLFNYGTVRLDCVGEHDPKATRFIKKPKKLEAYLQTRIIKVNADRLYTRI